jgi:hypothetical protein
MSNVNVKFSYKRADEDFLLEPTFEKNNTLSLTYKGPKKITVWVDPLTGNPVVNSLVHETEEEMAETIRAQGIERKAIREVVLDAEASDIQAMGCWFIKSGTEHRGEMEADSEQWNTHEYEEISYEFNGHTIEWEKLKNPNPQDLFYIHFRDWDGDDVWDVDFVYRTVANDTTAEILTKERLHQVKWFADEYDLGDEAEALAAEFIKKATQFIKDVDRVRPWHLKEPNKDWAPKIPMVVATALAQLENAGLTGGYVPLNQSAAFDDREDDLMYRDLHNG